MTGWADLINPVFVELLCAVTITIYPCNYREITVSNYSVTSIAGLNYIFIN